MGKLDPAFVALDCEFELIDRHLGKVSHDPAPAFITGANYNRVIYLIKDIIRYIFIKINNL